MQQPIDIWCVYYAGHPNIHFITGNYKRNKLKLWRESPTEFMVIEYDEPVGILTGSDYILLDSKYEALLTSLAGQVETSRVIIRDKVRNTTFDNFIELKTKNEIDAYNLDAVDSSGVKLWHYKESKLFVSGALKQAMQDISATDLEFGLGRAGWIG